MLRSAELLPWRRYVGPFGPAAENCLDQDFATGFRWILIQDRSMSADVIVHRVTIVFRA